MSTVRALARNLAIPTLTSGSSHLGLKRCDHLSDTSRKEWWNGVSNLEGCRFHSARLEEHCLASGDRPVLHWVGEPASRHIGAP
jgi:hypothetical protein